MVSYSNQYKLLFFFSWILFFLIYPAWALPVSLAARAAVFSGLAILFFGSLKVMHRWFASLTLEKPFIVTVDWSAEIKNNSVLMGICCTAAALHIYPIFFPILIMGDETIHLTGGLLLYKYIDVDHHVYFQTAFWITAVLVMLGTKYRKHLQDKNTAGLANTDKTTFFGSRLSVAIIVLLAAWFLLLKDMPYDPALVRYPPLGKMLYFTMYAAFGIDHIYPRMLQLIFYLLCAVYLYRTIGLFHDKETALLGALIYLFMPVAFVYGYLGELAGGTIFFIVITSFYFLRFIKNGDERDLVIAAYLIGIACLYKKLHVILFIVCFSFLLLHKIKKRDFHSLIHFKILSLSLVLIVPWMIITKYFSWRNYTFVLSNLTSMDSKIVTYLSMISSNISLILFTLFTVSALYFCVYKRSTLTHYFGLVFVVYYFFIVSDIGGLSPRFSMALYPTIAVYSAIFISRFFQYLKWRHIFKAGFISITICLVAINTVSALNERFLFITDRKLYYFPVEDAMKWVRDNMTDDEKLLNIRILSSDFYKYKYALDNNKIVDVIYSSEDVADPEKLVDFYKKHNISYIMFPYNEIYTKKHIRFRVLDYLVESPDRKFKVVTSFARKGNLVYIVTLND